MTHSSPPKVALLGRPNVGKSTLFNRLIRSNRAITHDRPGVTRDRMEGRVIRGEDHFILIDTGGVTLDGKNAPTEGPEESRGFEAAILEQAELAVNEAALILLVVGVKMLTAKYLKAWLGESFNFVVLGVILALLLAGVVTSLVVGAEDDEKKVG